MLFPVPCVSYHSSKWTGLTPAPPCENKSRFEEVIDDKKSRVVQIQVMSRLQFGKDSLGKEILELVPARAASPIASSPGSETGRSVRQVIDEAGETDTCLPYKGENTIVMMEWERPYMRALVDALGITGAVTRLIDLSAIAVARPLYSFAACRGVNPPRMS